MLEARDSASKLCHHNLMILQVIIEHLHTPTIRLSDDNPFGFLELHLVALFASHGFFGFPVDFPLFVWGYLNPTAKQVVFTSHTIDTTGGSAYGGHIEVIDLPGAPRSDRLDFESCFLFTFKLFHLTWKTWRLTRNCVDNFIYNWFVHVTDYLKGYFNRLYPESWMMLNALSTRWIRCLFHLIQRFQNIPCYHSATST